MMEAGGAGGRDERVPQWGAQETRELIAARGEMERKAVAARRSPKTMWEAVAARLRERGYRRTADQCKCKWKNLVNRYKGKETSDPDNGRECPFFEELHAVFTERARNMQHQLLESESGASVTKKLKRPSDNRSSEGSDVEEDCGEESEDDKPTHSRKRRADDKKQQPHQMSEKSSLHELLQDFLVHQQHIDMQWQEMTERRAQERLVFEQEWQQSVQKLEQERLMLEHSWIEREDQRRMREEARAERRDALLTTLLNKLLQEDLRFRTGTGESAELDKSIGGGGQSATALSGDPGVGREPRSGDGGEAAPSPRAVPPSPRPPPQPPYRPRARLPLVTPPPRSQAETIRSGPVAVSTRQPRRRDRKPWLGVGAERCSSAAALVLQLAVCSVLLLFPSRVRSHGLPPPATAAAVEEEDDDDEWEATLQKWKGKTYALSVPLRVVALRGSFPSSWVKDFVEAQGKRLEFSPEFRASLDGLFSEMSQSLDKGQVQPKSAMAADVVSIGDSWLGYAIRKGSLETVKNAEEQDWFKSLSDRWKVHLCRNQNGDADPDGSVWGAPYRWGTLVIAYKKNQFKRHNLKPIQDWEDLWRPELAGKISMVDSPREVIGAVLKHLGSSYNTTDMDAEVNGGKEAVLKSFTQLQKQVQLFDSMNYLKSFSVGDVWVAVGWSSDVIPAAKRMSNVAVVVPKSGSSLWADLWVIPCTTKFQTTKIGGRIRGPSPLIHQWFDFCLQSARSLPFRQEIIPGASPLFLESPVLEVPQGQNKRQKLDTNLVRGVPPPEILEKCEFLEPLSDRAQEDYQWLESRMQRSRLGLLENASHKMSDVLMRFRDCREHVL